MLKIIANGANYDVSAAVRRDICRLLSDGGTDKNAVFIVPDQFEFETEKAVYRNLSEQNLLTSHGKIHIETFSSLSEKILENAGEKRITADDTIKNIIMHKAVREQKSALSSLSRQADRPGFCKKMLTTVSVLKTAGLSAEALDETVIRKNLLKDSSLKNHIPIAEKLCDVSKIVKSYESCISNYIDKIDAVGLAADIVSKSSGNYFGDTDFFVDCFNDFTGNQLYFLMKIIEKANSLTLGFTVNMNDNSRENLFLGLKNQINRIVDCARENGADVVFEEEDIPRRFAENSQSDRFIGNIFGEKKCDAELDGACEIIRAADIYAEIDYIAAKIRELCTEGGFLYREIAVLCADSAYGKYVKSAFDKYDIPYFLDIPEPILYRPTVNFFLSLLNAVRDFSVESILSLIKTDFLSKPSEYDGNSAEKPTKQPLSKKDIDDFETYIFEWDLRTKHLKKPFVQGLCEHAEIVRKAVVEPVLALRERIKGADGAAITRLIYEFAADEVGIERVLYNRCLKPNSDETDTEQLRVSQQLWDSIAVILETLERELTGENITLDEYYRLFSDICSGTVLAKPPQFQDCVLVGDIDRTRAVGVRAAFIPGATYDAFPTKSDGAGIFSESEAEFLRENIGRLCAGNTSDFSIKSTKEQYCLSLYRAYKAVSLASERVSVIFPEYDISGKECGRSQIIDDFLGIFPRLKITNAWDFGDSFYCRSIKSAKSRYALRYSENSREKAVLRGALRKLGCGDFVEKLDEIGAAKSRKSGGGTVGVHTLAKKTAQTLFNRTLGATSAERLSLCKFRYFCESGLDIRRRNQRAFNSINRGNAVHYVLQKILGQYRGKTEEFCGLSRNALTELAVLFLNEFCIINTNGDFEGDRRTHYLFLNLAHAAVDVLITLQAEFSGRDYRPQFFELDLSDKGEKTVVTGESGGKASDKHILVKPLEIRLNDGSVVNITGKIDRTDMFFPDDKTAYIRVIDYKSGAKSFDVENAKHGINIQMLLYLCALCDANAENETGILPGGISYIPSAVTGAVSDKISAFRLLATNHRQYGLYIKDEKTDAEENKYADFIIGKIADEERRANNPLNDEDCKTLRREFIPEGENAPDAEKFRELRDDCLAALRGCLDEIFEGNVSALPIKYRGTADKKPRTSCDYCEFSAICLNRGENIIDLVTKGGGKDE